MPESFRADTQPASRRHCCPSLHLLVCLLLRHPTDLTCSKHHRKQEKIKESNKAPQISERSDPWVRKTPCRRQWQLTPASLPGEFHGQRSLAGYSPWAAKSQTWLSDFYFTSLSHWRNCSTRKINLPEQGNEGKEEGRKGGEEEERKEQRQTASVTFLSRMSYGWGPTGCNHLRLVSVTWNHAFKLHPVFSWRTEKRKKRKKKREPPNKKFSLKT